MDISAYQKAAEIYVPLKTNILFIAESPPSAMERYFYFEHVRIHDWLWIGLMKAIYGTEFGEIPEERTRKEKWLTRFKNDGYRLINALKKPLCQKTNPEKRKRLMRNRVNEIILEVKAISPKKILLIKTTVYDALYEPLRIADSSVVDGRLSFPGSGHQNLFQEGFRKLVDENKLRLSR